MLCPKCKTDLVECIHAGDVGDLTTEEAAKQGRKPSKSTPPGARWGLRRQRSGEKNALTAADCAVITAESKRLMEQLRSMGRCA